MPGPAPVPLDPVALAQALIRCPSITPIEGGALDLLQETLVPMGFTCHRLVFEEPGSEPVDNLYARIGTEAPNFCYAGHTDVVPVGNPADWRHDPFAGVIEDAILYGRGAVDMKGAIAAFCAALSGFLAERGPGGFGGSVSLLITGDEEAVAINGTRKVLTWLAERGEALDCCLVGEPTSGDTLGDTIKIGRRGSLSGRLVVYGTQGHTAYPQHADNPIHHVLPMLAAVTEEPLDQGNAHFEPSRLQITTVDVGNPASNVIPAQVEAAFNVRFNDQHSSQAIIDWMREGFDRRGARYDLSVTSASESFLCPPGPHSDLISTAVTAVTGLTPVLATTGGTSDARFIKDYCTVAELGLKNETAHKVDEQVSLKDLKDLTAIYRRVLDASFPLSSQARL